MHGLLNLTNIRITLPNKFWGPPSPPHYAIFDQTKRVIGPSGVRALPLDMRRQNVVASLNGVISLSSSSSSNALTFLPERRQVGLCMGS